MRWVRAILGTITTGAGLYFGFRAIVAVSGHEYVLAIVSSFVSVASLRAGSTLLVAEVGE